MGMAMTVAGGAIVGALGLAVKAAISFNLKLAEVATLIPNSTKRVIELKGSVQDLAIATGKSTTDITSGLYQVISAFGDTADTVEILDTNVRAAAAGMATTTDSINLTSAVMKGYGDVSAEANKKVADLAFQTVKLGQTTFPELASSMGRAIPVAAKLGVSQEELFTGFATLTGVTGDATMVTTQLFAAMNSIMKPSTDMAKAIKKLGYHSAETMVQELGLVGSMRALVETTDGSVESVGKLVPNIRALPAVFALTGGQAEVFDEKLKKMKISAGAMEEAFKEMSEGINKTGFNMSQLKEMTVVLTQRIGDSLAPAIGDLVISVSKIVTKISDWIKEHPKLTQIIAKAALGVGALMTILGPLLVMLPGLVIAFTALLSPIGLVTVAIGAITTKLILAIGTFNKFKKSLNDYLDASGKKMSGFEKTWHGLTATIHKHVYGVDAAKFATEEYTKKAAELNKKQAESAKITLGAIKETGLHTKAIDSLKSAFGFLIPKIKDTEDAEKDLDDETKNLTGTIKTIVEVIENDFGRAGRNMADVIDWMGTSIGTTAIPAMRDLTGITYNVQDSLQDLTIEERRVGEESKKVTKRVKSAWQEVSTVISDMAKKWADAAVDMLGIAKFFTYQMKEFDNSYWQNAMQNAESAYGDKKDLLEKQLQDSADYYKELTKKSTDDYNKQKEWINLNISDEEQKQEMLLALEEQHQQDLNKFRIDEEQKESDLQNKLVDLEEDHQIESERIRKEEDLARDQHATDEEDRQRSLWTKVKGIFGTAVEDMLKIWLTKFVGGIITSTANVGTSIVDNIGGALGGVAEGAKTAVSGVNLLGSVVSGAVSGLVSGLVGGKTDMDATNRELHNIWAEARNILQNVDNMKWQNETLKKIGWKSLTQLGAIKDRLKGGLGIKAVDIDFTSTNDFLKQIRGNTALIREWTKRTYETLKVKSKGWATGFEGIVNEPIRPLIGEAGPEYVSVQPLSEMKKSSPSSNVTVNNTVVLNGTVVTDREHTRNRIIPEMLLALEANFEKTKMKQILGIA